MRTNDTIEMSVVNNNIYSSTTDSNKTATMHSSSNVNNNNSNLIITKHRTEMPEKNSLDENDKMSSANAQKQYTTKTIDPNLYDPLKHLNHISDRGLSRSVPALSTGLNRSRNFLPNAKINASYSGITASPKEFRSTKPPRTPSKSNFNCSICINLFLSNQMIPPAKY